MKNVCNADVFKQQMQQITLCNANNVFVTSINATNKTF